MLRLYQLTALNAAELVLIGRALDRLPHGQAKELYAKIQAQITAQDDPLNGPRERSFGFVDETTGTSI